MLVESIWLRYHLIMPADRLYRVIERLGYLLRTDIHRDRDGHGALQPAQRAALEYLARCNRLSNTPAAVTEFLQLTKGTVSQTLGVLARRGLVEKRRDGTDRRVVRLALTPAGRRVVAVRGRIWRRACEVLDAKQIARAGALLEDVVRGARRSVRARGAVSANAMTVECWEGSAAGAIVVGSSTNRFRSPRLARSAANMPH